MEEERSNRYQVKWWGAWAWGNTAIFLCRCSLHINCLHDQVVEDVWDIVSKDRQLDGEKESKAEIIQHLVAREEERRQQIEKEVEHKSEDINNSEEATTNSKVPEKTPQQQQQKDHQSSSLAKPSQASYNINTVAYYYLPLTETKYPVQVATNKEQPLQQSKAKEQQAAGGKVQGKTEVHEGAEKLIEKAPASTTTNSSSNMKSAGSNAQKAEPITSFNPNSVFYYLTLSELRRAHTSPSTTSVSSSTPTSASHPQQQSKQVSFFVFISFTFIVL